MFWIAGMALETKFKVKTCQTMRYLTQARIFVIPHTPSIDDLGFDCGVCLSHSLAFLLRQVIYKLRRISLHGIKKLQIKLTQVHSKRKHDVLYKQCNHISFVSPFDLSVQTCNVSIMFGK